MQKAISEGGKSLRDCDKSRTLPATVSRRSVMRSAAGLLGASAISALPASALPQTNKKKDNDQPNRSGGSIVVASDQSAIAETVTGRVRGYVRRGIYTYKGIPYGEIGEHGRFRPAGKPKPWSGVRSSMHYGRACPQGPRGSWDEDEESWLFCFEGGVQGEECLRINIWTPGINDNKKRPVMVWLHGGGFVSGSSQELAAYDGERLSRRGDVVLVSLNHRLGVLGFLGLSEFGDRYESSANVGMLDVVMALEWVRDNISKFGGDPANVTIFGQSGGGGKVGALMTMPAAKGLFHRAIVQSGSFIGAVTPERSASLTRAVFDELKLSPAQVDQLQDIPLQKLIAAADSALVKTHPQAPFIWSRVANNLGWGPVVDGKIFPQHPFVSAAPSISAKVPMLIGTTLNEFTTSLNHPEREATTEAEAKAQIREMYQQDPEPIFEVFQAANTHAKPFDLLSLALTAQVREGAVVQAQRKTAQGTPSYLYWFTWKTPVLDGRIRSIHACDLPFCFDNTDLHENLTGGGPEPRALAAIVSDAWIHFARTGNPEHAGLPHWPPFSKENCPTMIFDTGCKLENNPDKDERQALAKSAPFKELNG